MSKAFHAEDRITGERWKPDPNSKSAINNKSQFLVMYDSGYCAVVTTDFYTYIEPLDTQKWKVVYHKDNK